MKNLENLQLQELTIEEQVNTDGGGWGAEVGGYIAGKLYWTTAFGPAGSFIHDYNYFIKNR